MKCTTCTQTDFESIHGRIFCAHCGVEAQKRLQNFTAPAPRATTPAPIRTPQVLDLSATVSTPPAHLQETGPPQRVLDLSKPSTPAPAPVKAQNMHAQTLHKAPEIAPISTAPPMHMPTPVEEDPFTDDAPPVTPESSFAPQASVNSVQPTYMQPHQTYTVKEREDEETTLSQVADTLTAQTDMQAAAPRKRRSFASLFSHKAWRVSAVALSMVLLTGYVTYLNYPNITLRMAANRANIEASMPGYLPSGYSFSGPIAHSPGQLVLNFRGRDGGITLSQSVTRWDSQSLLENKIRLSTSEYDTYRENGLTIYTYEGRHAAWINSGILYEIESESELDPDEIIRMASSL